MRTCGMLWIKSNDNRILKKHLVNVITNVKKNYKSFFFWEVFLTRHLLGEII
jgi:hypothetical protein